MSQAQLDSADDTVPDFITPKNILDYSDEEIDALLDGIRLRRMIKLNVYNATVQEKERIQLARLGDRMQQKSDQFLRQLLSVDKALEKLEKITNEIRGLRLQLCLDPM